METTQASTHQYSSTPALVRDQQPAARTSNCFKSILNLICPKKSQEAQRHENTASTSIRELLEQSNGPILISSARFHDADSLEKTLDQLDESSIVKPSWTTVLDYARNKKISYENLLLEFHPRGFSVGTYVDKKSASGQYQEIFAHEHDIESNNDSPKTSKKKTPAEKDEPLKVSGEYYILRNDSPVNQEIFNRCNVYDQNSPSSNDRESAMTILRACAEHDQALKQEAELL